MDEQSGFNLLQAAVFEGEYDIVSKAAGLLDNFAKEMERTKTGNNAKNFPGKTAVHILVSLTEREELNRYQYHIKEIYQNLADDKSRLTELQRGTCNDDSELAVELVLNDDVDINASGSDNDWTALLHASRSSSSQFIETLIDLGADVNAQREESIFSLMSPFNERNYKAPLMLAVDGNNYMAACLLLRHGAGVNVQNSSGSTPLHLSVGKNYESLVRLFLEHNADVNTQNSDGYTPLRQAAKSGNENLVRLFLERNARVNIQDKDGHTPLHKAVINGKENLVRLFLEHHADANIQDKDGHTPLHKAVINGKENLVRLFLEHHADANIPNKHGETQLLSSFKLGHENLIRLLVEHNADVNIPDNDGYKLLQRYVMGGDENLIRFLIEHNADVNIQNKDGYTLLHRLVIKNDENRCRWLLEHNADANIQDNNGYTPLHRAVVSGAVNLIELLLEHKADVNIQHKFGFTPLHLSARFSHKDCNEIIDLLLQYGVQNIDIRDVEGRTPLQMAVRCGNAQAVKKLVDLGADVSLVKTDKKDAVELERLYNEAENVE